MISHKDIPSRVFKPEPNLVLVKPRELPKGEVIENGLVIEMEQNTSVVDRPTFGKIIAVGRDVPKSEYLNKNVIWISQDGIDIELEDGGFMVLKLTSILGIISENE